MDELCSPPKRLDIQEKGTIFAVMFLKYSNKIKDGKPYKYYRICESYRDSFQVRNRTLLSIGDLPSELTTDRQFALFIKRLNEIYYEGKNNAIPTFLDETVERVAHHYANEIRMAEQGRKDKLKEAGVEEVYIDTLKNEHIRELGAEWLCQQAVNELQLPEYLSSLGWSEQTKSMALTHIISRAVYPVSELKTVSYLKENSALSELTKIDVNTLTKDTLYKISHQLYHIKDGLEQHLSRRTNDLFGLEDKIILYDLTNTYFEGRMQGQIWEE